METLRIILFICHNRLFIMTIGLNSCEMGDNKFPLILIKMISLIQNKKPIKYFK